jgi:hypothetical protein
MPLSDGYGVGIGTFNRFYRDPSEQQRYGRYYHGHIVINVPTPQGIQQFEAAVDVNKPDGGVQYFMPTNLKRESFAAINALPDGFHRLASNSTSGALDYARSELIGVPLGCLAIFFAFLRILNREEMRQPWTTNVGDIALTQLESLFANPASINKVYLFGEPYRTGFGAHNVHLNQGDPAPVPGSPNYNQQLAWYRENGIWQDGGVIVKYNDGRLAGFFVKFVTQTLNTNDEGHPR